MPHGHIYFEIQADDVIRAKDFYSAIFDWQINAVPYSPHQYHPIATGGSRGGIMQRPAKRPPQECGTNAFCCSIQGQDINAMSAKIIELGGTVALPKFAITKICWHAYSMIWKAMPLVFLKPMRMPFRQ